jgi:nicotinic acid phosphoribosyltransferase
VTIDKNKYASIAPLLNCDAYKLDHRRQYGLSGTVSRVYSNFTNRKSRLPGVDHVVHFGLQAWLRKYLMDDFEIFFESDEDGVCGLYEEFVTETLGPNGVGSDHIRALHQLGYLPLRFCAVPEGTRVPIGVPTLTVENTIDEFFWLTNYIESSLSVGLWQASTSATIAHEYREVLTDAAVRTGAPLEAVDWQSHDFSMRGMSSHETVAVSGAAHLLSFSGSDSLPARLWIDRYYSGGSLGSVPATEHSVMCTGIAAVGELEIFRRLLQLYPTGIVSVVSDTFDLWKVLTEYLPALKDEILARDGKLVIRPDSGDPVSILLGAGGIDNGDLSNPEVVGVVETLWRVFGGTTNKEGFRELDPHIGVIYGDSITLDRAETIVANLEYMGYASTTITLGVGSFTYQHNTRDTFGSAMKATWSEVDGKPVNLFKDPITDDGTKRSATGRLAVVHEDQSTHLPLKLIERATQLDEELSVLQPVWEDGKFVRRQTFEDVRRVLNSYFDGGWWPEQRGGFNDIKEARQWAEAQRDKFGMQVKNIRVICRPTGEWAQVYPL